MNRSATTTRKAHTFSSGSYLERLMGELDRASIALRLAEARERAGLTQEELGDLLHVHWRTIQNYESPRIDRIPWDRLDEWGRITDTTKEWLLHGDPGAEEASLMSELRWLPYKRSFRSFRSRRHDSKRCSPISFTTRLIRERLDLGVDREKRRAGSGQPVE